MIGLTGLGPLLDLLAWFYWYQAFGFVAAALTAPRTVRGRVIAVVLVVIAFSALPLKDWIEQEERQAYAKAAREHYAKLCAEKAGIKIYRKVSGVKSVVVLKPLPPSTDADNFNQYWYGDPYSGPASEIRLKATYARMVAKEAPIGDGMHGDALEFVEVPASGEFKGGGPYFRVFHLRGARQVSFEPLLKPVSRFGVEWEDISTPEDRRYWVAGSRLRVLDLADQGVVAERIGFVIEGGLGSKAGGRRPWLTGHKPSTTCPRADDYTDRQFFLRVLDPSRG